MNTRVQRILLIVLMVAGLGYTIFNYLQQKTELSSMIVIIAFLGWLLFGQISALIREWDK